MTKELADALLQLSQTQRLCGLFMCAPVAIAILRAADFVFTFSNPAFDAIAGRTDLVGRSITDAFPELTPDAPIMKANEAARHGAEPFTTEEYCIPVDRDGDGIPEDAFFKFSIQPVCGSDGAVTDLVIIGDEVTGYVEARRRIEALMQELQVADRRKDEFLATLAHELRNPMAAISSALTLLDHVCGDAKKDASYRAIARRQMTNLVHLVDDLLDVARITRGKIQLRMEDVDLATVVQEALTAAQTCIGERHHELRVVVAPGRLRVRGDSTRLEQIVVNLLTNAAKYTDPGGHIEVRLEHEAAAGCSFGGAPDTGRSFAVLRVRDDGRGIPPSMLEGVFDLFTQVSPSLDRTTGGLGLGLTLVKHLVGMHGGTVSASSDGPGKGSELVVKLPCVETNCEPTALDGMPHFHPSRPSRRVLLVEDADDLRDMMKETLESLGHQVFTAADGVDALDRAAAVAPEVALIDIGLPRIDGYEVARRLRATEQGSRVHLVALTGYGGEEATARAREAGFDVHVTKPVELARLSDVIDRASPRHHGSSGSPPPR